MIKISPRHACRCVLLQWLCSTEWLLSCSIRWLLSCSTEHILHFNLILNTMSCTHKTILITIKMMGLRFWELKQFSHELWVFFFITLLFLPRHIWGKACLAREGVLILQPHLDKLWGQKMYTSQWSSKVIHHLCWPQMESKGKWQGLGCTVPAGLKR